MGKDNEPFHMKDVEHERSIFPEELAEERGEQEDVPFFGSIETDPVLGTI
jgi:hypothetical protein